MFKVVNDASRETIAGIVLARQKPNSVSDFASKRESSPAGMNPGVHSVLKRATTKISKDMEGIDHFCESCYPCIDL
jgi:hypothetical protein